MRKGDATKARILHETARQAAVKGFGAVSLSDVAEAVGLSKSGLFKHFESKETMELAALDQDFDRFVAFVWTPVEALPPGRARLQAVFENWLDWSETANDEGGCLIMAASVELDGQPGPLRDLLQRRVRQWRRALAREWMALREPPLSEDEAEIATFQMKSFVLGHNDARRLLEDAGARRVARQAFEALVDRTASTRGNGSAAGA